MVETTIRPEQKLRTQRILGQLIKDGQERGEIASAGNPDKFNSTKRAELKQVQHIDDLGLNHKQSSAFQAIAEIPEETFETFFTPFTQNFLPLVLLLVTSFYPSDLQSGGQWN